MQLISKTGALVQYLAEDASNVKEVNIAHTCHLPREISKAFPLIWIRQFRLKYDESRQGHVLLNMWIVKCRRFARNTKKALPGFLYIAFSRHTAHLNRKLADILQITNLYDLVYSPCVEIL